MIGIILDVDGTLVDNNVAHIEAWRRAFAKVGYDFNRAQLQQQLGKGGDLLVPSLIGEEADAKRGKEIRALESEAYLSIARQVHFPLFNGTMQLCRELRRLRVPRAIATSSEEKKLRATLASARLDLDAYFAHIVTAADLADSKPAPDLVTMAASAIGMDTFHCVMVGDTLYDAIAALRAGAGFIGLTCGGTPRTVLLDAGARVVYRDPAELGEHLDTALELPRGGEAHAP